MGKIGSNMNEILWISKRVHFIQSNGRKVVGAT